MNEFELFINQVYRRQYINGNLVGFVRVVMDDYPSYLNVKYRFDLNGNRINTGRIAWSPYFDVTFPVSDNTDLLMMPN